MGPQASWWRYRRAWKAGNVFSIRKTMIRRQFPSKTHGTDGWLRYRRSSTVSSNSFRSRLKLNPGLSGLSGNMSAERTNPERHLTLAVLISGRAFLAPCACRSLCTAAHSRLRRSWPLTARLRRANGAPSARHWERVLNPRRHKTLQLSTAAQVCNQGITQRLSF